MANYLQLYRTLPLNDSENTQLFTFKLGLMNLEEFKSRSVRSTIINYQGHDWYLSCKYAGGKRHEFLGVYVYWGSPAEGVRCRADFRIITRNILDPTKSLVTEGSQVEFSAPQSPGWGKREFAPLRDLLTPGQGFILEPEKIVIIELAMKSCSTIFEQSVDFAQLLSHRDQPYPSFFTANFPLAGMEFYLSLYPLGDREEANGNVSMYLHRFLGNDGDSSIIGCRIRYRFFLGHNRTCPSSSKTFEFSFKNEQGYGRFKAFEPLNSSDNLLYRGAVPLGIEILGITPFAQPEIRLTTRGYYHTDNFVFEDATFPDHRGNAWRLSAINGSQFLALRLDTDEKKTLFSATGLLSNRTRLSKREECTKFVQWRAFILSRTDRKKTMAVNGCPLSAYYSRELMQTNYSMSTQIPLSKAKALDGDYCTKDEPSLLVRIEFLNVQDIAGVMTDYPTLDFERFQLYHTREGLKRCLKQNEHLVRELESLNGRLNTALKENKDSQDLVQDFQKLLKMNSEFDFAPGPPPPPPLPSPPVPRSVSAIPPLPSRRDDQLMAWLFHHSADFSPDTVNNARVQSRQLPPHTPSTRPASISSSPTLPPQAPMPRPRTRGTPPRPPPRAYSPIATDLVTTRPSTNAQRAAAAVSTSSPVSPPPAQSSGMAMVTDHQRLLALNSNDTAFKRFSFTGINITPSMISRETSETSTTNVDSSAESASSGKEQELPQHALIQQKTNAPSVVMSKIGDDGTSRGFALARMARPPINASQSSINHLSSKPQSSSSTYNGLSCPRGLSAPLAQNSQSTGDLNQNVLQSPKDHQHTSNGHLTANSGVTNGLPLHIQQSASSPNISSSRPHFPDKNPKEVPNNGSTINPKPIGHHSVVNGHQASDIRDLSVSPTVSKGFVYTSVPGSVLNRRSPVQDQISPPFDIASQRNQNWPKSLPVHHQSMTQSSESSLSQVSTAENVISTNSTTQQNDVQEQAIRQPESTPTSPNRRVQKQTKSTSKSTPTTPTKQHFNQPHQIHQQIVKEQQQPQIQDQQQAPPSELSTQMNNHITWNAGLSVSRSSLQSSTGSLNQNPIYEPLPAHKTGNKIASQVVREYLLEQKPMVNGRDQVDNSNTGPSTVAELRQKNGGKGEDSTKRWSIPAIAERQRLGVIETSL